MQIVDVIAEADDVDGAVEIAQKCGLEGVTKENRAAHAKAAAEHRQETKRQWEGEIVLVDTPEKLADMTTRLEGVSVIGFDAEWEPGPPELRDRAIKRAHVRVALISHTCCWHRFSILLIARFCHLESMQLLTAMWHWMCNRICRTLAMSVLVLQSGGLASIF